MQYVTTTPSKSSTVSTSDIDPPKSNLAAALRKAGERKTAQKIVSTFEAEGTNKKTMMKSPQSKIPPKSDDASDKATDDNDSVVVVNETTDPTMDCLDFICLMDSISYLDGNGRTRRVDILKPVRSPINSSGSTSSTSTSGVYTALQEKGNLANAIMIKKKADSKELNEVIDAAIGRSKYLYYYACIIIYIILCIILYILV